MNLVVNPTHSLSVLDDELCYVSDNRIEEAPIIWDDGVNHLGKAVSLLDIATLAKDWRHPKSDEGFMLWAPGRNTVTYCVSNDNYWNEFARLYNGFLKLGKEDIVCAISVDGKVWVTFDNSDRQQTSVWRVDPVRRKVIWRRKLSAASEILNDETELTSVSWSAAKDAAPLTFTGDSAGSTFVTRFIGKTSTRTVVERFEPPLHLTIKYSAASAYSFRGGALLYVDRPENEGELACWNARTHSVTYPKWGRRVPFGVPLPICVSPSEDRVAFVSKRRSRAIVSVYAR